MSELTHETLKALADRWRNSEIYYIADQMDSHADAWRVQLAASEARAAAAEKRLAAARLLLQGWKAGSDIMDLSCERAVPGSVYDETDKWLAQAEPPAPG